MSVVFVQIEPYKQYLCNSNTVNLGRSDMFNSYYHILSNTTYSAYWKTPFPRSIVSNDGRSTIHLFHHSYLWILHYEHYKNNFEPIHYNSLLLQISVEAIETIQIHCIEKTNSLQYSNSSIVDNSQSWTHCPSKKKYYYPKSFYNQYWLIQANWVPLSRMPAHYRNSNYQSQHFEETWMNSNQPH